MKASTTIIKILHLEDMREDAALIAHALRKQHCEILVVSNRADFIKELRNFGPDIILADHTLPAFNSLEALAILKYSGFRIPFILVSGNRSEDYVLRLMEEGMDDYIMKDRLARLPSAIAKALQNCRLETKLLRMMQKEAERAVIAAA